MFIESLISTVVIVLIVSSFFQITWTYYTIFLVIFIIWIFQTILWYPIHLIILKSKLIRYKFLYILNFIKAILSAYLTIYIITNFSTIFESNKLLIIIVLLIIMWFNFRLNTILYHQLEDKLNEELIIREFELSEANKNWYDDWQLYYDNNDDIDY